MSDDVEIGLRARGIGKRFGATSALDDVNFSVLPGEIHALLGENGAGKSTLVKIITGSIKPDRGSIEMDGVPFEPSARSCSRMGFVIVHQELSLLNNLTVAENISLGQIPLRRGALGRLVGHVDRKAMMRRAKAALELMALEIDPQISVSRLGQAERQLVEITRALAQSPKIILLDEPTSSLPPNQREALFRRMKRIRATGVGIVFITHFLEETLRVSDRITVLRDGRNVSTVKAAETTVPQLIEFMSGHPPGLIFPLWQGGGDATSSKLSVERLSSGARVRNVTFSVCKGEVVGLAGLVGSGRTETLKAIFGSTKLEAGTIRIDGEPVRFVEPADAIAAGIAFIPENRQEESLFLGHSITRNICVAAVSSGKGNGLLFAHYVLRRDQMKAIAEKFRSLLQIKAASVEFPVSSLSGGNQQKTVLARWMATKPEIILADEPTRGISIVNKIEVYKLIRELASQGAAIVITSSEFEELVGLCDRVFIIRDGVVDAEIRVAGVSAKSLLEAVLASPLQKSEASREGRLQGITND